MKNSAAVPRKNYFRVHIARNTMSKNNADVFNAVLPVGETGHFDNSGILYKTDGIRLAAPRMGCMD